MKVSDLPIHVQLMLLATRLRPSGSELAQMQALAAGAVDWSEFLAVTLHQRVGPLVFESLQSNAIQGIPAEVYSAFHAQATINAFAAFRAMRQVQEINERFSSAGFVLTTLKGVPLSQRLFGGPNMRHVGDIDLLTTPEGLPEQLALFAELGYHRVNPRSRLTPRRLSSYTAYRKDFTLRNREAGFEVDLHWRLFDNRLHPGNRILDAATCETAEVFGVVNRVFSLQDQFLYTLAHGVSDAWMYLKSLADAAACLRGMTLQELDQAILRAQSIGLLPMVAAAIHTANRWMGAEYRHPLLEDGVGRSMAEHVEARMIGLLQRHGYQPNRSHVTPLDWLTLETQLVPGIESFSELFGHVLWRPRAWSMVDLPDHLFWVYPLIGMVLPPRRHSLDY